jgi:diketogulonate reductase-like aldo/keto reductase
MEYVKLNNNIEIPAIIFGPAALGYTPHPNRTNNLYKRAIIKIKRKTYDEYLYTKSVANAIKIGFNSIDFSASYGDGSLIAKSIKKSGIDRKEIMITTRVSNKAQFSGDKAVEKEVLTQLKGFGTEYIDMLMFHWPVTGCFEKTWLVMMKLQEQGICRMLGVANCHEHHLEKIYEISGVYPLVNQIEVHPLFTQVELRRFCKQHNIQIEGYTATGRQDDRLMNPPLLNNMAKKYNKTKTQIILRWHFQNGIIPVIRSLNPEHQRSNIDIFDFVIDDEDMRLIDGLNLNSRLRYNPDNCDFSCL